MNGGRSWFGVAAVMLAPVLWMAALVASPQPATAREASRLWLYYSTNLLMNANVRTLQKVWRRAATDGYSHVLLADSKFARLATLGTIRQRYVAHVAKVTALARQLHLTIIPDVFQVGYSNDLLSNNPSMAAGLPVRDVKFIVRGGVARVWRNPAFGFSPRPTWKDSGVHLVGNVATIRNNRGNSRMVFTLNVQPFHAYHIRVDIRTRRYTGVPHIRVLARGNASLQYQRLNVRPSQPWRCADVVFDSLAHHHVSVYFGVWGAAKGLLAWRNWHIAVAGLVNALSRPGAPTVVRGYQAGIDYASIRDPRLGTTPYSGQYTAWHKSPSIHFLKAVPNGTVVRVSWFYPPIFYDGQVSISLGGKQTRKLFRREIRGVRSLLHSHGYMISFDEIRIMGWGRTGGRPHRSPGQRLAGAVRYCTRLLGPARGYIWSDMFDPYHNAKPHYYLVNGSLRGSWRGLSRKLVIMNWNFSRRDAALKFFADRGYRQIIAGYYDSPLKNLRLWMASAAHVKGIIGYMYTTWRANYGQMKAFAQMIKHHGFLR